MGEEISNQDEGRDTYNFRLQLLTNIEEIKKYPFTKMVIDKELTKEEYLETMKLLKELDAAYQIEKEEGLLNPDPLLMHFAGMLCYKLPIKESLQALYEEGIYTQLMKFFQKSKLHK